MRYAAILGVLLLLAGCGSSNGTNKDATNKDKSKVRPEPKDPRTEHPSYALYLQNKISPSVSNVQLFNQAEVKYRFRKGAEVCDGAFLIKVAKVEADGDKWTVLYDVEEKLKIKSPLLDQAKKFQFAVENGRTNFQMTKDTLVGAKFILLLKLQDGDTKQDSYDYYWQLYPNSDEVKLELAKLN